MRYFAPQCSICDMFISGFSIVSGLKLDDFIYSFLVSSDQEGDSAVWKIALVVSVLLVSIVGSLSMAYYLCVWRGGRIHYEPHKEDIA